MRESRISFVAVALVALPCACSKSERADTAQPGTAQPTVAQPNATGEAKAEPTVAVSPNGAPRELRGTGIQVAFPPGTQRMGRELAFRVPVAASEGPTLLRIDRRVWASEESAVSAVGRTAGFLGMANEFFAEGGDAELVTESPERAVLWGTTPAKVLGDAPEQLGIVMGTRGAQGSRVFMRASFPAAARSTVESIAKSIDILPDAELDPLSVHGIDMAPLPEGYSFAPGQLAPLWVLAPDNPQPFIGATFELRVFGPGQLQRRVDDALATFRGDRSSCSDANAGSAAGAVKLTEAVAQEATPPTSAAPPPGKGIETVSCKFEAMRGLEAKTKAYFRLLGLQDAEGTVMAVIMVPEDQSQHLPVFEKIAESIRLKAPSAL